MSRKEYQRFICLAFQVGPYMFLQTKKGLLAISLN